MDKNKRPQHIRDYAISVIVPVYDEADNLEPLITEITESLAEFQHEIIYVDDASRDKTWSTLQSLKSKFSLLKSIRHKVNNGQSAAIVTGVRAAKYPWIITMDGDGQNDPRDITELLQIHLDKTTKFPAMNYAILGNRAKRNDNWIKRASSRIGNFIRSRLLGDNCPDSGCSLRLFSKEDFIRLPHFKNMHRFFPTLFTRAGLTLVNVHINHRPRLRGQSKYGVFDRLWASIFDLIGVFWLLRRNIETTCDKSS